MKWYIHLIVFGIAASAVWFIYHLGYNYGREVEQSIAKDKALEVAKVADNNTDELIVKTVYVDKVIEKKVEISKDEECRFVASYNFSSKCLH